MNAVTTPARSSWDNGTDPLLVVGHVGVDSRKILTTLQTPAYHTYLCPDTINVAWQRPSRIALEETERSELSSEKPYWEGKVSPGWGRGRQNWTWTLSCGLLKCWDHRVWKCTLASSKCSSDIPCKSKVNWTWCFSLRFSLWSKTYSVWYATLSFSVVYFPVKCSFLLWSDNDRHQEFVSCFVSLFCDNFTIKCCSQLTLCVRPYDCPLCFDYCSFCRKLWNRKVWAFQLCSSFSRLFMATWISVWVLISAYYFLSLAIFILSFCSLLQ